MRKTSPSKSKTKVNKEIVICEANDLAVVFENGRASEFFLRHGDQLVGDIIWGQVDAVVPGIEAAFVNIGQERNGFIHVADLPSMQAPRKQSAPKKPTIKVRDRILVQIAKAPTGSKGARLTGRITIPGRFLVLVPHDNRVSISRRITEGAERERLRNLTLNLKDPGHGLIVRTEAIGRTEEELRQDIDELIEIWADILHQVQIVDPPALLHRDSDLIHRVLRDALTGDVSKIIVDTHNGYHKACEILQGWMPEVVDQVELHEGAPSIMERYKISEELDAAISPKVWLPSGGYLVLEHTEALTVIDVNSGRLTQSKSLAETVLRTNIEAAGEIARQLRLRDIGGIIVIDFISMDESKDRQKVYQAFVEALKQDKSRPQVTNFSEHGLIEVSRRRQGQNLLEQLTLPCDLCGGTGRKKASHLLSETPVAHAQRVDRMGEEAAEIFEEMEAGEEEDLLLDLGEGSEAGVGEREGEDGPRRRRRRRRRGRGRGGAEQVSVGPILSEPGDAMIMEEELFSGEPVLVAQPARGRPGRPGGERQGRPGSDRQERGPRPAQASAPRGLDQDELGLVEEVDLFGDAGARDLRGRDGGRDGGREGGREGGRQRDGREGRRDRGFGGGRERFGDRDRFGNRDRVGGRERFGGRERPAGGEARPAQPTVAAEASGSLHVSAPAPRVRRVERRPEGAEAPITARRVERHEPSAAAPAPAAKAPAAPPASAPAAPKAVAPVVPAQRSVAAEKPRPAPKPLPVPEELAETAVPGVFVLKKKGSERPSLDALLGMSGEDAGQTTPAPTSKTKAASKTKTDAKASTVTSAKPSVAEKAPEKTTKAVKKAPSGAAGKAEATSTDAAGATAVKATAKKVAAKKPAASKVSEAAPAAEAKTASKAATAKTARTVKAEPATAEAKAPSKKTATKASAEKATAKAAVGTVTAKAAAKKTEGKAPAKKVAAKAGS
ncbi:MAG: Rne/Rng family ribonuclease [Candidatus Sericytochromatia bacterium]|nr:Rne/Rng family ribonuclease [Candidatus Sericytochromatia bacterium]